MTVPSLTSPLKILISFGTRPELIKLAPLIRYLFDDPHVEVHVHCTGQHTTLLQPILSWFEISPDTWSGAAQDASLTGSLASMLDPAHRALVDVAPDVVIVHGDTTSALAMSLAAFYLSCPIVHLEAGLRTYDPQHPWPEETHRRLLTVLSSHHLAPTLAAQKALVNEGVRADLIEMVGNTVIDALLWSRARLDSFDLEQLREHGVPSFLLPATRPLVVVTAHRRENFTEHPNVIVDAIAILASRHPEVDWLWPVHPNPRVYDVVHGTLSLHTNVHLVAPLSYPAFVHVMTQSVALVTDSGGIQEEATAIGVPVAVLRKVTERQELIQHGQGIVTGLSTEQIVETISTMLTDVQSFDPSTLYGPGDACELSARALHQWFTAEARP